MIFVDGEDPEPVSKSIETGMPLLKKFLQAVTLRDLKMETGAYEIKSHLSCLQSDPPEKPWEDSTNTPDAFIVGPKELQLAVTAVTIMRGGQAIPDAVPVVQCFAQGAKGWSFVAETGDDFRGKSTYFYPLRSPIQNEAWFAIAGSTFGDSGSRLLVEVFSCDGKTINKRWKRDGLIEGLIEVDPKDASAFLITYAKAGEHGIVTVGNGSGEHARFSEVLHVTKNGIE